MVLALKRRTVLQQHSTLNPIRNWGYPENTIFSISDSVRTSNAPPMPYPVNLCISTSHSYPMRGNKTSKLKTKTFRDREVGIMDLQLGIVFLIGLSVTLYMEHPTAIRIISHTLLTKPLFPVDLASLSEHWDRLSRCVNTSIRSRALSDFMIPPNCRIPILGFSY
ncbi:hypothetical protein B9Z19DRAFT_1068129 [Tuber borchii]|uniref:Uncharacterized protein n=1 Tax=Tuber borchii TaxID=42251 RepID=A0A2T6ZGF4_TUBBO|nr:hypothetical protein B9Z19DRAFT_1068129 [Tuber borchii]